MSKKNQSYSELQSPYHNDTGKPLLELTVICLNCIFNQCYNRRPLYAMAAVHAAIGSVSDVQDLSSQITNKISAVVTSNLYKIGKLCVLRFQIVGTFVQTDGITLMTLPIQSKGPFDVCVTNYNTLTRLFSITSGSKNIKMYWGGGANTAVDHIVELVFISN